VAVIGPQLGDKFHHLFVVTAFPVDFFAVGTLKKFGVMLACIGQQLVLHFLLAGGLDFTIAVHANPERFN